MGCVQCYRNRDITCTTKEANGSARNHIRGDSTEVVTFELSLDVRIGVWVRREEKGILSRRSNTKRTGGCKYRMISREHTQSVMLEQNMLVRECRAWGKTCIFC